MTLSENDYLEFARQGYNRIPLMREVLADLDTPVSTYLKLANRPCSYLLESVEGGEKWGRYSIIGLPSAQRLEVRAGVVTHVNGDNRTEIYRGADPLSAVAEFGSRFRVAPVAGLPRFTGGLVGYFGYDIVNYVEPRLAGDDRPDTIGSADAVLMLSEEVVVFDNLSGRLLVIVHADPGQPDAFDAAGRRLDELTAMLRAPLTIDDRPGETVPGEDDFRSNFDCADFEAAVGKAREYIYEGDIFQVVLSQRLDIPFTEDPVNLYRALRTVNPSPYMYLIDLGEEQIVGSSPEILVRLEDGVVTVRPIAGTRRRGRDEADDERLAEELMGDPKELAEHLMLVDLGRNDVGRVAEIGSVELTERMKIERYSHVMHIVSNVTGRLAPDLDAMDVLKAAFPAGTVSGAPKIRAMEIIRELEPERRGIYAGAVGYLGWNGNMDTAIAIRTAVLKDGRLFIQAGAGIVADSVPAQEYMETMNKGRAVFRAVTLAASGLRLDTGDL